MAPTPGLLFVRMNPHDDLSPTDFHDWYNNEHGPMRLRLSCIKNGFRYRAIDVAPSEFSKYRNSDTGASSGKATQLTSTAPTKAKPEWLAVYDLDDMASMDTDEYMKLRDPPWKSQREKSVMSRIDVDRRLYDEIYSKAVPDYQPLDILPKDGDGQANVDIVASGNVPKDKVSGLVQWYETQRISEIKKEPSWRRSRIFQTSTMMPDAPKDLTEVVVMHEFASSDTVEKLESKAKQAAAADGKWSDQSLEDPVLRPYELHYVFGAGPRHLSATASPYEHAIADTKTVGAEAGQGRSKIESYATASDGVKLPYLLEGAVEPDAPLILLSNSVLVDWHIWDEFVDEFLAKEENKKYRVLRYLTRGRTSDCGSQSITVDVLAGDILAILDQLRVPKAKAVIGVSLGGATVLNFALKYPKRVDAFVSCDTNSNSPPGNSKLWLDRIAVAEEENVKGTGADGKEETIIGEKLAELTVRRWAVSESYDGGKMEKKLQQVKDSVFKNSLHGFKSVVKALWEYDMRPGMKDCPVRGLFIVGSGDGKLPTSMKEMAESYGKGAPLKVIDGAGHLPMVEKPKQYAAAVTQFLEGSS